MANPKHSWFQFSLRAMLIATTAACLLLWYDPLGWKLPGPVPIETLSRGAVSHVDLIYISAQQEADGRRWRQVTFWSRYPDGELHVREWRLIGSSQMSNFQIERNGRFWDCTWTENGTECHVQAPSFRESEELGIDSELADRAFVAKQTRVPLWEWARP